VSGGGRLSLTEGTIRALGLMHAYRFLTIVQFARGSGVIYKHGAEVFLSLERLEAVGFIGYTSIPWQGKTPKLYFLKRRGFAFLSQATDSPGSEIKSFRETHKDLVWTPAMYHRIRLTDCFLALERGVLARPQLSLQKTFLEYRRVRGSLGRETTDYIAELRTSENRIVPDGAFILQNREKDRSSLFFVEMNMGTERVEGAAAIANLMRLPCQDESQRRTSVSCDMRCGKRLPLWKRCMARPGFMRVRHAAIIVFLGTGTPCGTYAAYCGILAVSGNFHTVKAGQLYRSAQLNKTEFGKVIESYHIKSVLNLRGPNPESIWYKDELAAMREHAVHHYDVGISAHQPPTTDQMAQILTILRTAPKPLLIHCKAGSDRTGLVAALYRYAIEGEPEEQAASELSLRFGHFPYLMSKTGAMDDSFSAYVLNLLSLRPKPVVPSYPLPSSTERHAIVALAEEDALPAIRVDRAAQSTRDFAQHRS
jgi:protein tyrosine phosphatase (PTP) superfamily phosphohydrolase (DUF442 family)